MGIESVMYRVQPSECDIVDLVEWLRTRGANQGNQEDRFVISETDYWMDLLVLTDGPRVAAVQLRVAVTNPISVVRLLDDLVTGILARFGGRVTDVSGRRVLSNQDRHRVMI